MKMIVYAAGEEEIPIFRQYQAQYGIDLKFCAEKPGLENLFLADGMDCINVLSDTILTEEFWNGYQDAGIRLAVTRTIGTEHMNVPLAEARGIAVRNITYSPASVADYAIMMMLMVLRQVKPMLRRYAGQDYTVAGLRGRELPNMTVGIIGTGRIGATVVRHLSGFGCRILCWNRTPKPELSPYAECRTLDTLLEESDIVSLHLAAGPETYQFMNADRIAAMKDGAVLINTARGSLVDNDALISALESGHLGGAGLDVFDGDRDIYYRDFRDKPVCSRHKAVLDAMPNVLMLPHMAYYTDQALEDMVRESLAVADEYFRAEGLY